jgi:hypothetical protein
MKETFEQIQRELGNPVVPARHQGQVSAAKESAAQEERERWQKVFASIPAAQRKMATFLLGDSRSNMTTAAIIEACNVGHTPSSTTHRATPVISDTPALSREQELGALAVKETARLLGIAAPASLPELPRPIPRAGREHQIDPALQIAAEALAKRLAPITCQS